MTKRGIVIDPAVMSGKPCIKGTRIPVNLVLRLICDRGSLNAVLDAYPHLNIVEVRAAVEFAISAIEKEYKHR